MRKGNITVPNRRVHIESGATIEAEHDELLQDGHCPLHGRTRMAKMHTDGKWHLVCCGRVVEVE